MKTLLVFATLFAVLADTAPATDRTDPIDIGSRRELFVDRHLIESLDGARLTLHHPQAREVVFTCDRPWEGNWSGLATHIQDGDTLRMYYTAGKWGRGRTSICYAESGDGVPFRTEVVDNPSREDSPVEFFGIPTASESDDYPDDLLQRAAAELYAH